MLSKKHLLVLLFFLLGSAYPLVAQDDKPATEEATEDGSESSDADATEGDYPYPPFRSEEYKAFVPKGRQEQQDKFMDRKYDFPARPRDRWEIGIDVGPMMISGDIKTGFIGKATNGHLNLGYGLHVRKSFGYLFSLRANYAMGTAYGHNWQGTEGWNRSSLGDGHTPNQSLAGSTTYADLSDNGGRQPDYRQLNNSLIFYNYQTKLREAAVSGIISLHNIRFHKRETKVGLYGVAGIGAVWYRVMQDQLNGENNEYDYSGAAAIDYSTYANRGDVYDELNALRDGTYESQAERHFDDYGVFLKTEKFSSRPTAHVGVGIDFKVSRRINIGLETKVTYTNDDLLDGQRWQEWGALTRDYDTYTFTGAHVNFNIGGKNSVEPLWWMNPLDYGYKEMNEAPCCDDMELPDLADNDKDGVPNAWDKEPNSREGCPVDTHGRMLDSDRDGVLDCDDREPHTRYDAIKDVDKYGVAPKEPKEKLKLTCEDLKAIQGGLCECIKGCVPPPHIDPCANLMLPTILFDLNKYSVKPEFEGQLAEVARILRDCPSTTLCVIGNTDVRASNPYNDVLSYKRAKEVIDLLVSRYGVNPGQLTLQYRGESSPVVDGLSDSGPRKGFDADHALNRRVEFQICPPGGNMAKPKGPNAGRRQP
ncbi:MAG: OmpA family protein [Chitinophagales bacterium]|nr:OmpA family protein [Chitinophagales bacterium]